MTEVAKTSDGTPYVTELDTLVSNEYASGFYDSCKDVKFGGTNGRAMDLIGGGAQNFSRFLKFLGDRKALGSPFQINFPRPDSERFPAMTPMNDTSRRCNDDDPEYRCACVDCSTSCPTLPKVDQGESCHVGLLPCLSFAAILIYSIFILLLVVAVWGHVVYQNHKQQKQDRLRLLQDASPSDDEDEGDMMHSEGMLDRPQTHYRLNTIFDRAFGRIGRACAEFPLSTITISLLVVVLMSLGWMNFSIETDPVRLWVAPDSAAAKEKDFFDTNFGPFFRAEQVFLTNVTSDNGASPVLSYDTLRWWFDVESRVRRLKSLEKGVTLDQICYKPTGDACVIQSVSGYFGSPYTTIDPDDWQDQLLQCAESPVNCLPEFQQPLKPKMILGGFEDGILNARALVVTWVVKNHEEGTLDFEKAQDWENSLEDLLKTVQAEARERGLRLSFSTETSLEQELNKSTNTDAKIVVISYIIMFLYASLALGSTALGLKSLLRNPAVILVQSKFSLGVAGILIVLMSVSASVGLFSAVGIKVTLIIAEVIPFLVLAVGVDNIFLLVHELERVNISHSDGTIPDRIARTLGRMGPSILLSAITETVAFALGCFVGMPAVRNFAAYAAGAVFINAFLQVTMFVAVLALNERRVEASRADCVPCIQVKRGDGTLVNADIMYGGGEEGVVEHFVRRIYAPAILNRKVKVGIVATFLGVFMAGLALLPKVQLGLDQRIAIPSDSYLISYFNDLDDYFGAGPPVYFVTRELNVTQRTHQKQLCGRFSACDRLSLATVLEQERKRPEVSYLADSAASWLDDFFTWLNPTLVECCVNGGKTCFEDRDPPWNTTLYGMPEGREFVEYLERWIKTSTTEECPLAGRAAYGDALVIDQDHLTIPASHFRTSHTPLKSQADYINAYKAARRISEEISSWNDIEVFPYSKFYIFFDQYTSIVHLSATLIGSAVAIIFAITSILLGSIQTGLLVSVTVVMIIIDIVGTMAVVGVSLNAVSLVNLVICVGIGVEFCAHIARAFTFPSRTVLERAPRHRFRGKDSRAWTALVNVGGSVFTGITLTKLLGVSVLAFTRSKIFEIYYFRIWLALIFFAATHALVFLPVALSILGGKGKR